MHLPGSRHGPGDTGRGASNRLDAYPRRGAGHGLVVCEGHAAGIAELFSAFDRARYAFQNVLCCLRPSLFSMEMLGRGALLTLLCPCECSIDERPSKAWARSLPHLRSHPNSRLPSPHPRASTIDRAPCRETVCKSM